MRVLVFFDLPTITLEDKKEYRRFRKFLQLEGFIMLQESVYSKLLLNSTALNLIKNRINKNKPKNGLVQMLMITEKQFHSMEYLVGNRNNNFVDSDKGVIIL